MDQNRQPKDFIHGMNNAGRISPHLISLNKRHSKFGLLRGARCAPFLRAFYCQPITLIRQTRDLLIKSSGACVPCE